MDLNPNYSLVLAVGEALFDVFEDHEVLGGAPVNAAVHTRQLLPGVETEVSIVSRVGQDRLGGLLAEQVLARGLALDLLQTDASRSTGRAVVTLDSVGHATFEIEQDAAWDAIEATDSALEQAARASAVLFGSLAQRAEPSRSSIRAIVAACPGIRLFDVNLRQNHYTSELIHQSLTLASHAKVNQEELAELDQSLGIKAGDGDDDRATAMLRKYDLQLLSLTRGEHGCVLYTPSGRFEGESASFEPERGADTVGAGDSTNAALIAGLLRGRDPRRIATHMNRVGAYVATRVGATPKLPDELIEA
ncbi:MAG: PfkB family carbohydrate kinase [Phycisphaeraceae bacterium]